MMNSASRPPLARLLPTCLALQLLTGCGWVLGEGDDRFDDVGAASAWFEQHRGELEVIMRLLLPHERIGRVRHGSPPHGSEHGELSRADAAAYAAAFAIKERLGIPEVLVSRPDDGDPAFSFILWRADLVSFVLWKASWTGSGSSTAIEYNKKKLASLTYWERSPYQFLDLGEPGWFAYTSGD